MEELKNRKRNFFNPEDPYFKRKIFSKMHKEVYATQLVLNIISPTNHAALLTSSHEQIKKNSKDLMEKYCDKEHAFNRKKISEVTQLNSARNEKKEPELNTLKSVRMQSQTKDDTKDEWWSPHKEEIQNEKEHLHDLFEVIRNKNKSNR